MIVSLLSLVWSTLQSSTVTQRVPLVVFARMIPAFVFVSMKNLVNCFNCFNKCEELEFYSKFVIYRKDLVDDYEPQKRNSNRRVSGITSDEGEWSDRKFVQQ